MESFESRLAHRTSWLAETGTLPVVEEAVIRLEIDRLPSGAIPRPVWLWHSRIDAHGFDLLWQTFQRRFDIEHTFRPDVHHPRMD